MKMALPFHISISLCVIQGFVIQAPDKEIDASKGFILNTFTINSINHSPRSTYVAYKGYFETLDILDKPCEALWLIIKAVCLYVIQVMVVWDS